MNILEGNYIDISNKGIYSCSIFIENGKIKKIDKLGNENPALNYFLPGFVDAHIHIESSMLTPTEFGRLATVHGTIASVSDPHEIGNVLGIDGVNYMIENGKKSPFKFYFGAPSCVPATTFETAGAAINLEEIKTLFENDEIVYLSEMMNFPGVIYDDELVMAKIRLAHQMGKKVDGHAPGLRGDALKKYIAAGISTDHECFTYDEAKEKLSLGMKILIREGSAAKNFEALIPLIDEFPDMIMFCSDDKHPNDLLVGHINLLVKRAIDKGYNIWNILKAACINPVKHYGLNIGQLKENDAADLIIIDNLTDFNILKTFINGELVAENGLPFLPYLEAESPNNFNTELKQIGDFELKAEGEKIRVIEALEGQLITNEIITEIRLSENGNVLTDVEKDILKIAVVNRYNNSKPAVAFIKNFGLKNGALASSVAHDSHNIVVVGVSDEDICAAVNEIIRHKGGLSLSANGDNHILSLPLAGIMTTENGCDVANKYTILDKKAKELGTTLNAPFMTLSFMALLVIPSLKLSDKGLFDVDKFAFTTSFVF
ncbi:MAG: adenine deaminase [Bacteroidetes bacterium]|nr:adenine deaminase [Bacteroidota bacterium]MBK8672149.1 adenine deaminase [Bacteroidota bacterium]MBK9354682.1 adenine deaminase [Bacteroidota bacterium]MBK9634334.1 adenine deaminase [Bacteroidota bacterium]MBP7256955.1 adenine deaminase [Chitinophagales bacterium]